ncbi:hypothetical protein EVAR_63356_1 [Eumeta japonica]|uniref:Uncharacterized protein n=1 Tax=Eumeta variegata TaxID=151549 RepID=A0A4C2A928_EUMVA|nr:hypothetical protein EVAR_63356_1 [Eumeta japonica]
MENTNLFCSRNPNATSELVRSSSGRAGGGPARPLPSAHYSYRNKEPFVSIRAGLGGAALDLYGPYRQRRLLTYGRLIVVRRCLLTIDKNVIDSAALRRGRSRHAGFGRGAEAAPTCAGSAADSSEMSRARVAPDAAPGAGGRRLVRIDRPGRLSHFSFDRARAIAELSSRRCSKALRRPRARVHVCGSGRSARLARRTAPPDWAIHHAAAPAPAPRPLSGLRFELDLITSENRLVAHRRPGQRRARASTAVTHTRWNVRFATRYAILSFKAVVSRRAVAAATALTRHLAENHRVDLFPPRRVLIIYNAIRNKCKAIIFKRAQRVVRPYGRARSGSAMSAGCCGDSKEQVNVC